MTLERRFRIGNKVHFKLNQQPISPILSKSYNASGEAVSNLASIVHRIWYPNRGYGETISDFEETLCGIRTDSRIHFDRPARVWGGSHGQYSFLDLGEIQVSQGE